MNIGFASADWAMNVYDDDGHPEPGGACWYRVMLPGRYLERGGHHVVIGTPIKNRQTGELGVRTWDGEHVWHLDLVVFQRWMLHELADDILQARSLGQVIVNDIDDHYWALDPRNEAHRAVDPKRRPHENIQHYARVLRASSLVTVSTPFLAEALRRVLGDTPALVLRNAVALEDWPEPVLRDGPPVIGWVGALPWRSGDVERLRGVLAPFLADHDLRFHHSGHLDRYTSFATAAGVPADRVTATGMEPPRRLARLYEPIDVGIVPLNSVAFNRAKSCIKGLEYTAGGAPFVASELDDYEWLHERGAGQVARRPRDWTRELARLLDPDVRHDEWKRAHDVLRTEFDMAIRWREWEGTYATLLGSSL